MSDTRPLYQDYQFRTVVAVLIAAVISIGTVFAGTSYQANVNQENQTDRVQFCIENGYNAAECEDLGK